MNADLLNNKSWKCIFWRTHGKHIWDFYMDGTSNSPYGFSKRLLLIIACRTIIEMNEERT